MSLRHLIQYQSFYTVAYRSAARDIASIHIHGHTKFDFSAREQTHCRPSQIPCCHPSLLDGKHTGGVRPQRIPLIDTNESVAYLYLHQNNHHQQSKVSPRIPCPVIRNKSSSSQSDLTFHSSDKISPEDFESDFQFQLSPA